MQPDRRPLETVFKVIQYLRTRDLDDDSVGTVLECSEKGRDVGRFGGHHPQCSGHLAGGDERLEGDHALRTPPDRGHLASTECRHHGLELGRGPNPVQTYGEGFGGRTAGEILKSIGGRTIPGLARFRATRRSSTELKRRNASSSAPGYDGGVDLGLRSREGHDDRFSGTGPFEPLPWSIAATCFRECFDRASLEEVSTDADPRRAGA